MKTVSALTALLLAGTSAFAAPDNTNYVGCTLEARRGDERIFKQSASGFLSFIPGIRNPELAAGTIGPDGKANWKEWIEIVRPGNHTIPGGKGYDYWVTWNLSNHWLSNGQRALQSGCIDLTVYAVEPAEGEAASDMPTHRSQKLCLQSDEGASELGGFVDVTLVDGVPVFESGYFSGKKLTVSMDDVTIGLSCQFIPYDPNGPVG